MHSLFAGLYVSYGTANIWNSIIRQNDADLYSVWKIYFYSWYLTYYSYGGGAYLFYGYLNLFDAKLVDNVAKYGGGVYSYGGGIFASGTIFRNNTAAQEGGGLYVGFSSELRMENSEITGNKAEGSRGGGCYLVSYSTGIFNSSTVNFNTAGGDGAGISAKQTSSMFVYGSILASNDATGIGGAIQVEVGYLTIEDSLVEMNTANFWGYYGGGIEFYGPGTVTIRRCVFSMNNALGGVTGGGIGHSGGSLILVDSIFINNEQSGSGKDSPGLIFFFLPSPLRWWGAGDGGGALYATDAAKIDIQNCTFEFNRASGSGGGILFQNSIEAQLINVLVKDNLADSRGGGVAVAGSGTTMNIVNSFIQKNSVIESIGGGLSVENGRVTLENCIVAENTVTGPTFSIASGSCTARGGCFYSDNFPGEYTGIWFYYGFTAVESCEIIVGGNGTLDVVSFSTQTCCDILSVGGEEYSGRDGPDSVAVSKGDAITFDVDYYTNSGGFQICYKDEASGAGIYVSGGSLSLIDSTITNNQATAFGGGLYVAGGAVTISGGAVLSNNASSAEGTAIYVSAGDIEVTGVTLDGDIAGTSGSGVTCASPCVEGWYGVCDVAEGTSECYTNCKCVQCAAGKASSSVGATSDDTCVSCGAGQTSTEDGSSECSSCPVGRFATNSSTDFGGGLLIQVTKNIKLSQIDLVDPDTRPILRPGVDWGHHLQPLSRRILCRFGVDSRVSSVRRRNDQHCRQLNVL
jgi:hypothetical protein